MIGSLKLLCLGEEQFSVFQLPLSHAQSLITTSTLTFGFTFGIPASWISPPSWDVDVASKPIDAKFPGSGLGMLL